MKAAEEKNSFGPYRILRKLAESGLGPIYLGEHSQTGELRVLKTLAPGYHSEAKVRKAFEDQDPTNDLQHPNLLKIYGLIMDNDSLAIVEEYVEGETLDTLLKSQEPLSIEESLSIFKDLCSALSYAHKTGAIHSDINPRNVFLEESTRRTVLTGFLFPEGLPDKEQRSMVVGNPTFFSPEQCMNGFIDNRSDIYSLGALFYTMLTGQRPFRGETLHELISKHLEEEAVQPRELNPRVPGWLSSLVMKMMAKNPRQRQQSCEEIFAQLETTSESEQEWLWSNWDDRYFFLRELKRGSCSMTYLALDQNNSERKVAITILTDTASILDRRGLERRAQIISKLPEAHFPNFCQSNLEFSDQFIEDDFLGETLGERVREQGALAQSTIVDFSLKVLFALQAVHSMAFVHGDINPETILLTEDQGVKLLESKFHKIDEAVDISYLGSQFMAPEQITKFRHTALSDLYSLGICLYYASTNSWPFDRRCSRQEINLFKQQLEPKAPLHLNSKLSLSFSDFIMKLIAKSPKGRYQSAELAFMNLERIASGRRVALPNALKRWFAKLWT